MPTLRPRLSLVVAVAAAALIAPRVAPRAEATTTSAPDTAVYSDSQAARGRQWYESQCQRCHPADDMRSEDFKVKWNGQRALDLFAIISSTMPEEEPGTLTRNTYVDIVAYLMKLNGIAATAAPLADTEAALAAVTMTFPSSPR